jgi:hypothetical protein
MIAFQAVVSLLAVLCGVGLVLGLDRSLEGEPGYTVLMFLGWMLIVQGTVLFALWTHLLLKRNT